MSGPFSGADAGSAQPNPLRDLLRTAADQMANAAEHVERIYRSSFVTSETLPGLYRGTVANAEDPLLRGRVQVIVPEAVADPVWAEVSRPLDGGNVVLPPDGTSVWVAFEHGEPTMPVVLGAVQP